MGTEPVGPSEVPTELARVEAEVAAADALAVPEKGKGRPIVVGANGLTFESAAEVYRMAQAFVQGGVAPEGANAGAVMASILKGAELGLAPVTAMTSIYIIKGRIQMSGALILGLLKRHGVRYAFHWEGEGNLRVAIIRAWSPDQGEKSGSWPEHRFSMSDAARAGLLTGRNAHTWKAWPDEMLLWRATAKMGRQQFPDICAGIYVPGELPDDLPEMVDVAAPRRPAVHDPLIGELSGEPEMTHAEADAALAESE